MVWGTVLATTFDLFCIPGHDSSSHATCYQPAVQSWRCSLAVVLLLPLWVSPPARAPPETARPRRYWLRPFLMSATGLISSWRDAGRLLLAHALSLRIKSSAPVLAAPVMHPASRFHLWFLQDVLCIFLLPSLVFTVYASRVRLGCYLALPCYLSFIALVSCLSTPYSDLWCVLSSVDVQFCSYLLQYYLLSYSFFPVLFQRVHVLSVFIY